MLKTMGMHKLVVPVIALLLGIGVILTGIGFAMEGNTDYLKEEGNHKWYQIIYIDDHDHLRIGVNIGDIFSIGNIDIPNAPDAPQAPEFFD